MSGPWQAHHGVGPHLQFESAQGEAARSGPGGRHRICGQDDFSQGFGPDQVAQYLGWKVDSVHGDRAVLRSCSSEWATTIPLTFDEWHEGHRWTLEAK